MATLMNEAECSHAICNNEELVKEIAKHHTHGSMDPVRLSLENINGEYKAEKYTAGEVNSEGVVTLPGDNEHYIFEFERKNKPSLYLKYDTEAHKYYSSS